MSLRFSHYPGRHERHLRRKLDNPLFPAAQRSTTPAQLNEAQRRDHEDIVAFIPRFRRLVQRTAELAPRENSEAILELKEALDECYEDASRLADDQSDTKATIRLLQHKMMAAVRRGAANDPLAMAELDQEELARATHFELLEQPLVADLLDPDSLIRPEDLVASLVSSGEEELQAALEIFDLPHLDEIITQAQALVAASDTAPPQALQRLHQLEQARRALRHR